MCTPNIQWLPRTWNMLCIIKNFSLGILKIGWLSGDHAMYMIDILLLFYLFILFGFRYWRCQFGRVLSWLSASQYGSCTCTMYIWYSLTVYSRVVLLYSSWVEKSNIFPGKKPLALFLSSLSRKKISESSVKKYCNDFRETLFSSKYWLKKVWFMLQMKAKYYILLSDEVRFRIFSAKIEKLSFQKIIPEFFLIQYSRIFMENDDRNKAWD